MFNVPRRVARIRANAFLDNKMLLGADGFDVDLAICPEQVLTDYIVKLVEFPEALQVLDFAGGKVSLVAVRAYQGGPMVGRPVKEIRAHMPNIDTRIVAIFRHDRAILPEGDTVIEADDEVFCLAAAANITKVMRELRRMDQPVKRVMIAGGGNIGMRLARALERDYSVRLIEHNKRRSEFLAAKMNQALVLNGDATDEELLEQENIAEMDLFVAVTNDDENNAREFQEPRLRRAGFGREVVAQPDDPHGAPPTAACASTPTGSSVNSPVHSPSAPRGSCCTRMTDSRSAPNRSDTVPDSTDKG
jgi:trk system potassium uptake protein TrkA